MGVSSRRWWGGILTGGGATVNALGAAGGVLLVGVIFGAVLGTRAAAAPASTDESGRAIAHEVPRHDTGRQDAPPTQASRREPARLRIVCLLAQFPDLEMTRPRDFFTAPEGRTGLVERLADYYAEVSHGRLVIEPTVAAGVVTVAHPRSRYIQKPATLVRDAYREFLGAGAEQAARRALEAADAVIVFFAGPGKESDLHGGAEDPWSNFVGIGPPLETPGGRAITKACVIAASQRENLGSFGVLCHEFGHLLGLPELYAPGGATHEGIGVWGLMGQGTWLGRGEQPPHPSAWSKMTMGWADVRLVMTSGPVTLAAADRTGQVIKIWARSAETPWAYYLIENRQRRGTDGRLPGAGLLVWRIDDRVRGVRTSQSDPERMRVTLVQADGRDDLRVGHRAGGNRGDATDPWHGLGSRARHALDAAIVFGLALAVLGGWRAARGRRVEIASGILLAGGCAAIAVGLAVPRSPLLRVEAATEPGNGGGGESGFTISDISPAGDPMTFVVTFDDAPGATH
jgi:immune inhibitor A